MKNDFRKMNVSADEEHNRRLTDSERFTAIEADILCQNAILTRLVQQNSQYTEYLDREIQAKKETHEFWMDIKKKLAVSTITGAVLILFTALAYAGSQWIKSH